MKKLTVHAAPRRAVAPPYRPAPREHLIFFQPYQGPYSSILGAVFLKKLNVHAAPRRAVPPPYLPAPREHLFFSNQTRVHIRYNTKKKSVHVLLPQIFDIFPAFLMF